MRPEPEGKELRDKTNRRYKLTEAELDAALDKLVRKYPPVEKRWADPQLPGQLYCSFSFTPAKGVQPNNDGLFGLLKIRGTFPNEQERDSHAEYLVNEIDSYHAVNHGYVGQPIPVTTDDDDRYTLEVENVALQKKLQEHMSEDMKQRKAKELKDMEEAKQRAKEIERRQESKETSMEDDLSKYTALSGKRANMIFAIFTLLKQLKQYKDTLIQTLNEIERLDGQFPEFKTAFLDKYNQIAAERGISTKDNPIAFFLAGPVPFDLNIIPDTLPILDIPDPKITYFDAEAVNPQKVAATMLKAKGKDGLAKQPKQIYELEVKKVEVKEPVAPATSAPATSAPATSAPATSAPGEAPSEEKKVPPIPEVLF